MKTTKTRQYNGILTEADMKSPKNKILYACIFAVIIIISLLAVLPSIWLFFQCFKDIDEMYAVPATFFPKQFEPQKLITAWNTMKFHKYYFNTFIMAGGSVAIHLVVSGLAGYVLSKLKPSGHPFITNVLFWLMLLPGTMSTVPLYMFFKNLNLLNTYVPIWIMSAADAFSIILFKNFFDGISSSLVEAAKIDGASDIRIFFKIIIPLSAPIFLVQGIFVFNGQFGTFFWPYLLISDANKTVIGVQIFNLKKSTLSLDYQMISLLFAMIPQLLIFAIFQKRIIGGINIGGVKG